MIRAPVKIGSGGSFAKGGDKYKKWKKKFEKSWGGEITVGFFSSAKYGSVRLGIGRAKNMKREPLPVAQVALENEFGLGVPERPFFRNAIKKSRADIGKLYRMELRRSRGILTRQAAERVGSFMVGEIQREITDLREPPNHPLTIWLKGSSNPLIDTGFMRQSVTFRYEPGTARPSKSGKSGGLFGGGALSKGLFNIASRINWAASVVPGSGGISTTGIYTAASWMAFSHQVSRGPSGIARYYVRSGAAKGAAAAMRGKGKGSRVGGSGPGGHYFRKRAQASVSRFAKRF